MADLKRLRIGMLAVCVLFPMLAPAETVVPYKIKTIFKDAGCRIVRVAKVARTDLDFQSVYVAWCSGSDVYLSVVKCNGLSCRIAR